MADKLYYGEKGETFKEAFAEARKEGKKTFEWNDKKYSTELKSPKASMDEGIPKKTRADEKVGKGYEDVGKEKKEDKEDKGSRGTAAALAGTGVALGAAAALSGMKRSEQERKERSSKKPVGGAGKMPGSSLKDPYSMNLGSEFDPKRTMRGDRRMGVDSRDVEFKKGGKVSSASARADGIAQRGKTKGRIC
jgi:hypothetical protein